jgi:hypothetical protein
VNDLHLLVGLLVGWLPLGKAAGGEASGGAHVIILQDVEDLGEAPMEVVERPSDTIRMPKKKSIHFQPGNSKTNKGKDRN